MTGLDPQAMSARPRRSVDWFLPGLGGAAALAVIFPGPGAQGGALYPELLNRLGVALIFFLHGLTLPFEALRAGMLKFRLHAVVQLATFVVCPVIGLLALWLAGASIDPNLGLGIFYLCALPSTVSSSVALTATAKGNVPAAVFNATLSSVLGVFMTPFWVGWVVGSGGHALPLQAVILDLALWLILPLVIGQLLRRWLGGVAMRHETKIGLVDRAIILLLVYTSFCDSVKSGVWLGSAVGLAVTLGFCVSLLAMLILGLNALCRRLGFSEADRIAAVFCGSKKTLASGVPMARLIFGGSPGLGVLLLPILIYHPLQLFVCGWLAGRWAKRNLANDPKAT